MNHNAVNRVITKYREEMVRTIVGPYVTTLNTRRGIGKGLDTCYSAAYMSQTRDQQRFTICILAYFIL